MMSGSIFIFGLGKLIQLKNGRRGKWISVICDNNTAWRNLARLNTHARTYVFLQAHPPHTYAVAHTHTCAHTHTHTHKGTFIRLKAHTHTHTVTRANMHAQCLYTSSERVELSKKDWHCLATPNLISRADLFLSCCFLSYFRIYFNFVGFLYVVKTLDHTRKLIQRHNARAKLKLMMKSHFHHSIFWHLKCIGKFCHP